MRFEVFHRGLIGRTDIIAVDLLHYPGMGGLCFSHHPPHNNNPRYADDTSTAGVLRYLDCAEQGITEVPFACLDPFTVTTHHFDADAFVPVWCLLNPRAATQHRALLESVARCGDLFIYLDEVSARLNLTVEALHQKLRGGGRRGERLVDSELTRRCFDWLLPRWQTLLHDQSETRALWQEPLDVILSDIDYLHGRARVTELWDCHTSLVEADHVLDDHALSSVCRNDILFVWRTDTRERRIDVRPSIAWYDLPSLPHKPAYDLADLCLRLNVAEVSVAAEPLWVLDAPPQWLRSRASQLEQQNVVGIIRSWFHEAHRNKIPPAYAADVCDVYRGLPRHISFTMHERFADAQAVSFAPDGPYGGIWFRSGTHATGCTEPGMASALVAPPGKRPLVFSVADDFWWNRRDTHALTLEMVLEDRSPGRFHVEYESWRSLYESTSSVDLTGRSGTRTVSLELPGARLSNGQEDGGDFLIAREPDTEIAVRELTLRKTGG